MVHITLFFSLDRSPSVGSQARIFGWDSCQGLIAALTPLPLQVSLNFARLTKIRGPLKRQNVLMLFSVQWFFILAGMFWYSDPALVKVIFSKKNIFLFFRSISFVSRKFSRIRIEGATPGQYYVMLEALSDLTNVTLTVNVTPTSTPLNDQDYGRSEDNHISYDAVP